MKKQTFIRLIIIFLVAALLSIFFFTINAYNANSKIKNSNFLVVHTNRVLLESEKVISVLKDIETGTRGFVITGDSIFLQPYFLSKDSIPVYIKTLKTLTSDDPLQQKRIDSLTSLATHRLEVCKQVQQLRLSKNYTLELVKPSLTLGKNVMDNIRAVINRIQQEEKNLLVEREQLNERNQANSEQGFYILFASILFFFITAFLASRYFASLRKEDSNALIKLDSNLIFFSKRIDEIVKGISDPFFAVDKNFVFTFHNEATQKSIGQGKRSLIGKNIFEIFPQYKENIIGKKITEVMQTKQSTTFEAYEDFLDQWLDVSIYRTSEGVSVHMKDATKRKNYEKELMVTRELLEATNRVALVGGWEVDLLLNKVTWTSVTGLIHETEPDYIPSLTTGINFYKVGESRNTITYLVNEAIEQGTDWDTELPIITAKGNEKWTRTQGRAEFEDGECVRLIGTFQDIDEQKKINDRLLQSEENFRSAFEHSLDGMTLVSKDGEILNVNKAFFDIVGYTKDEFAQLGFEKITHPDDLAKDQETGKALTNGTINSWRYEKRYIHKNGSVVHAAASGSIIKDKAGNVMGYVAQMQPMSSK